MRAVDFFASSYSPDTARQPSVVGTEIGLAAGCKIEHAESCTLSAPPLGVRSQCLTRRLTQSRARQGDCHAVFPISDGDVYFVCRADRCGSFEFRANRHRPLQLLRAKLVRT